MKKRGKRIKEEKRFSYFGDVFLASGNISRKEEKVGKAALAMYFLQVV